MASYRELIAWKKGMQLVTDVYAATRQFPREEMYGLTSQIRRSAVSVPSNVAEGHGRTTNRDRHYFITAARGSVLELQTQIEIALNVGYLERDRAAKLIESADEVGRIINGLMRSLRAKDDH